ncbi:hypothetical protein RDWZM_000959 [Blomia tropicalis]|uniref:Urocanate hydratase n=1 Tax=Blomia tropicalis TaxID=40697 RepID=A0A9Q0RQ36_BLOTA|nr:hypothetical protein RDWZM_000959 [Blomia tropicalis]
MSFLSALKLGIPLDPLPENSGRNPNIVHAPNRVHNLNEKECDLAVQNALRYFPTQLHATLEPEFRRELNDYGHIYMYRFVPKFELKAYPLEQYPAKCTEGACIMLMIMNNLDRDVAQFPQELVTYGGNGQVFSNWAQFWLTMKHLSQLERTQTMVLNSGHPLGTFPSLETSSRLIISNGNMVPNYSSRENYDRYFALGVTMYGQMTAGSFCYIGPQGIVHGTTITVLNAARKYLNTDDMSGKVFLSSGLGGMSGAQPKASVICGCISVIAEVSLEALLKRQRQGWVLEVIDDLDKLIARIKEAKGNKVVTSIGYHGNVVNLWERLVEEHKRTGESLIELASDQTSCHCPFTGGYYPAELDYESANQMMKSDPEKFKQLCQSSLIRQVRAINYLTENGKLHFWDYGNAFLLEAYRAGAELSPKTTPFGIEFRYPSYVQHIMGDIFSLGFDSPYRETSNIYDGSAFTADMALTTCIGNATRGATWVAIHNGGGVGFGEVINCGFGMVLDGTDEAQRKAMNVLFWDVANGLSRRSWSGNENAMKTIAEIQKDNDNIKVRIPSEKF